jgi:dihydrolipoamide dehydrogenase
MKNISPGRIALVLVLSAALYSIFHFDLLQYFSLELLNQQRDALIAQYQTAPLQTIGIFFGIYVLATGLSLPGAATVLTVAAGVIFGLVVGVIIVSFASTIGATMAFLIARYLFRDFIQERYVEKLHSINEGVKKDGMFYVFSLRLIPLFPFFVINIVMGLTPIKVWQYFIASQIGMLAGTIVYVNAGVQLAQLDSLSGIVSPALLLSFALLGLFPWFAKALMYQLQKLRVYRGYKKPKQYDYNMIVIGAGSGGLVSAYIASAVKAKVALIEKNAMGGDCLNTGCVPSKALIRSAKMLSYANRAKDFGFNKAEVDFSFADVMERVQRVIKKIEPHDSVERYTGLGVEVIQGEAKVTSPWTVEVNGQQLSAKNIVVATGARPFVPDLPGLESVPYVTSDTLWDIREQPKKLLILGGGPIGSELAQAFQRLGTEVTQVERGTRIMKREDTDVSEFMQNKFQAEGMRVLTQHEVASFNTIDGRHQAVCRSKEGEETIVEFDLALVALGRKANVAGFGLEELNVELASGGTIAADAFLRTNYTNIYVVGDVTGPYQFTHTASHQAWYAAVNALFGRFKKFRVDYSVIPWATYTDPEVARVGLNETEAKEQGIAYEVAHYGIDDLDRAIADEEDHGWIKVLTVPGKDKILGVTIVGAHASDIIAEYVSAMKHGLGLNKILGTIHIYPTLAESNKFVAGVWKKQHAPGNLLKWVEKFHRWQRG